MDMEAGTGALLRVQLLRPAGSTTADAVLAYIEREAIQLEFENVIIWVRVDGETDSLTFGPLPDWPVASSVDPSQCAPWKLALGKELFRYWELVCMVKEADGLQFSFGPVGATTLIQIEAAAGGLLMYEVVLCNTF
jgi:hypothetical protein